MAENKKSFILYADLIHTVEHMPPDKAGELFLTILEYVNDRNPNPDDLIIKLTFEPIKRQLKRDLKRWELECEQNSVNGRLGNLKRWHRDIYDKVEEGILTLEDGEAIALNRVQSPPNRPPIAPQSGTIAKIADNDNDTVTDIDIVNDDVKKQLASPQKFLIDIVKPEQAKKELLEDEVWMQTFKNGSPPYLYIKAMIPAYIDHFLQQGGQSTTLSNYKRHCANWCRKMFNGLSIETKKKYYK